ncbi:hypothetical protein OSTOST_03791 [Ostertagia ostertagi]
MGKRLHLPDYQLNVAQSNTETEDLPEQATELVRRLHSFMSKRELEEKWAFVTIATGTEEATELVRRLHSFMSKRELEEKWAFVTIATGTEEFCNHCDTPNHSSIRRALGILRKGIPKAFVVLLGPVHVASSYELHINLLRSSY